MRILFALLLTFTVTLTSCSSTSDKATTLTLNTPQVTSTKSTSQKKTVVRKPFLYGMASYYSNFENGRRTASGERYEPFKYTAASKTLPLGTFIEVVNLRNGRHVTVRVNDRGPYVRSKLRVLDLSLVAARHLDMLSTGLAHVKIIVLGQNNYQYCAS